MTKRTKIFKTLIAVGGCVGLLAVFFFSCEKMPEYCGDGNPLNAATQFCFAGVTYDKCAGGVYDPATQACESGTLKDKCPGGDDYIDPATQFCSGGRAYGKCAGAEFDPRNQICEHNLLKTRCPGGEDYINPATEFCFDSRAYGKCVGVEYSPANQICESNILKDRCPGGEDYINPTTEFCFDGRAYGKCAGEDYNPANQMCDNGTMKDRCPGGEDHINPAIEFCYNGKAYSKCGGVDYNPSNQICDHGLLKTSCGSDYFNPATEFCSGNSVYQKCGGEEYNPATQICGIGNTIHTICEGGRYVPAGTPCDGYILTTTAAPANGGNITRNPDASNYAPGTLVGVTATAASGYTFIGWDGASTSTSTTATITMDSNKSLVAMFREADRSGVASLATTVIPDSSAGTISLNPANSPGMPAGSYTIGTQITATAVATPHYDFIGWSGADHSNLTAVAVNMDGNKALIANFQQKRYTLTIAAVNPSGGGSVERSPSLTNYPAGTQVNITANPASGYRFVDWTVTEGSATLSSADDRISTVTMLSNATIRANFVRTFTLTVNAGTGGTATGGGTFDTGTNATITATPAENYRFNGWTPTTGVADPSAATTTVSMTANRTVTANFLPITYTLTVSREPTAGGTVSGSGTFNAGTNATITATPSTGYTFAGWTPTTGVTNPSATSTTVSMTASRTVTANFQRQTDTLTTYTLTVNREPTAGGTVTSGGTFNAGTDAVIMATPNSGYTFAGWTPTAGVASPSAASTTVLMTANRTVTANFQHVYTLTVSAGTGGTATGAGTFNAGTNATITATPNAGYIFSGWTPTAGVSSPSTASTTVSMTADRAVTANFQQVYTLTLDREPTAGGTVTGGGTFNAGTNATITATPSTGYTFAGWTPTTGVANPSATSTSVSMTANRTVIANFQLITYTLTVNREPIAGGTVTGGGTFNHGANATITATPNTGYRFSRWTPTTGAGVTDPSVAVSTILVTGNRTVTANFRQTGTILGEPINDSRDGKTYRTVVIGTQTWMAENLNYAGEEGNELGACYDNNSDNCAIYGRLYDWPTLMNGASSSSSNPSGVQGICPTGWHVPSAAELSVLSGFAFANGTRDGNQIGKLMSASGWDNDHGIDEFGFTALPGGFGTYLSANQTTRFEGVGSHAMWWSATAGMIRSMDIYGYTDFSSVQGGGSNRLSLRCIMD